jgi:hypothetical protein
MGNKQKKEIRTPSKDAWEGKAKVEKLSHTLLTGTEKRHLNIVHSYDIYQGQTTKVHAPTFIFSVKAKWLLEICLFPHLKGSNDDLRSFTVSRLVSPSCLASSHKASSVRCSLLLLTLASPHTSWSHRT